jgi:hypothetical protein
VNGPRADCGDCEAEALLRVLAVRELLEAVLWNEAANPLRAISLAISGLQNASNMLKAAGFEEAQA